MAHSTGNVEIFIRGILKRTHTAYFPSVQISHPAYLSLLILLLYLCQELITYIQILFTLTALNITSKFHTVTMLESAEL
jgi:hypothetical protein